MAGRPIYTIHSQTSVGAPPGDYRSFFPAIDSSSGGSRSVVVPATGVSSGGFRSGLVTAGVPPGGFQSGNITGSAHSAFHSAVYAGTSVPAQWQNGAPIVTSGFAPTPVVYHTNPPPWQHGTSPVVQQGIGVVSPVSGGTYHPSPVAQRADFPMNYSQYRS